MKRWQSVLATMAVAAAGAGVSQVSAGALQGVLGTLLLAIAGALANKTSGSNPDGTPASVAYVKETKL